ncbi:MAG: FAD binding domain-containing protein [Pseudomonadota bacterium]
MTMAVEIHERLEDAARAAAERGARYHGGGSIVMRAVHEGDQNFDRMVLARDPLLTRIEAQGDRVRIGAGVTMAALLAARETAFLIPAARAVGGPAIRTVATIGGNLFAAHPYGDLAVALLALGTTVTLAGQGREMPLEELLSARERHRPLVSAIQVTRPADGTFRFHKVTRVKPKGVSVMSMAALLPQRSGRVAGARVAYGAMGPAPIRVTAVERALEGRTLDASGIAAALAAATDGLSPPTDALASEWYRRETAPVHLSRLLLGG